MSGYLVRLKSKKQEDGELTKLTKLPFVGNVSAEGRPFSEIAHCHTEAPAPTNHGPVLSVVRSAPRINPLAEESGKRFDFCKTHRRMMGGECHHRDAITGRGGAGRTAGLSGCLLWRMVKAEPNLDRLAGLTIMEGVTIGGCIARLADSEEPEDLFNRDRRWVLHLAESLYREHGLGETHSRSQHKGQ